VLDKLLKEFVLSFDRDFGFKQGIYSIVSVYGNYFGSLQNEEELETLF
jgi:hypothetical protein